jgi:SAM-dependent methyltransferase
MARIKDPYRGLADIYDGYLADPSIMAFYREWQESLLRSIDQAGLNVKILVDLCCGTGNSTIPWTRQPGWEVIGIDHSHAMLRRARAKSDRVRWIRQDLRRMNLELEADAVTCHFDALNHILSLAGMERAFENIARLMKEGAIFQFDLNTGHLFDWLNAREKLYEIPPNYLVASNHYDHKKRIVTFNQLWFIREGRHYTKRKIEVQERAFSRTEIQSGLRKAGLRLRNVVVQRQVEEKPAREVYTAQKVSVRRTPRR